MDEVTPAKLSVTQPHYTGRIHSAAATDPWWLLPLLVAIMLLSGTMFLRSLS